MLVISVFASECPNNSAVYLLRVAGMRVAVAPLVGGFDSFAGSYGSWASEPFPVCDIRIEVTPDMLEYERSMADAPGYSDAYLQTLAVYRRIAELAPAQGRFLMHAAVVEYDGKAYAFTAPSGTGKSTHVRLWLRTLSDAVTVINGDKPLVRMASGANGASEFVAYGTPWCGKEGWNANVSAPLAGICRIERGVSNECRRVCGPDALDRMMRQVYMPREQGGAFAVLSFLDALLQNVPMYRLSCTMDEDAVRASFEAMTGRSFDECRE